MAEDRLRETLDVIVRCRTFVWNDVHGYRALEARDESRAVVENDVAAEPVDVTRARLAAAESLYGVAPMKSTPRSGTVTMILPWGESRKHIAPVATAIA